MPPQPDASGSITPSISATEPGPAVQDQQRQGVRTFGASVDEMDRLAVDAAPGPAASALSRALHGPPVEPVGPVAAEILQIVEVGAVLPGGAGDLVGPAGAAQPFGQVDQHVVGDGRPLKGSIARRSPDACELQRQESPRPGPVGHVALRVPVQSVLGQPGRSSSKATRASRRASAAPRQTWMPWPKPRCRRRGGGCRTPRDR